MNLTQAIIVFVVASVFVVAAFCLTAWYFDRKNRYKYESALSDDLDPAENFNGPFLSPEPRKTARGG
jgi:hypothetical protein